MTTREKTYVLRWLDAVRDADIPTAAKAVALAMATYADYATGHNMRAGTARLAHQSGLAERRTRDMIRCLREAGLILWNGVPTSPGSAREYQLTFPDYRQHRQPAAGVGSKTAAVFDRNTGNSGPDHRQPAATHHGHTKAIPIRASGAAALGRVTSGALVPDPVGDSLLRAIDQLPDQLRLPASMPELVYRALCVLRTDRPMDSWATNVHEHDASQSVRSVGSDARKWNVCGEVREWSIDADLLLVDARARDPISYIMLYSPYQFSAFHDMRRVAHPEPINGCGWRHVIAGADHLAFDVRGRFTIDDLGRVADRMESLDIEIATYLQESAR